MDHAKSVSHAQLHALYHGAAIALGADQQEANIYADCFARADLRHNTQGLSLWLEWALPIVEAGGAHFGVPLRVARATAASLLVDGTGTVGQVVVTRTMERIVDLAKESGVAIGLVADTTDCAMLGNYALQASERGCIGIATNTAGPASVAPWGGTKAVFGTNPLAMAVPAGDGPPLLIDMACASFSIGTLVEAARAGRVMDAPVVADAHGGYSRDPASIIPDLAVREPQLQGAILPEGLRGNALLLMVEILAGLLSGTGPSLDQTNCTAARPPRVGVFLCAIDVGRFVGTEDFGARLGALAHAIRAAQPGPGFTHVRLPGDRADGLEAERRRDGIAVSHKHWAMIQSVCSRYALPLPG